MIAPRVTLINAPSRRADAAIIVLSYNGLDILKRCLPSTFGQGAAVVVVDNGSTDDTAAYVREAWPRVAIVSIEFNVGLGQALNIGVRAIDARNVVLMNNDAIVVADAVTHLSDLLDANPSIGMAYPVLLNEDGTVQECGDDLHISGVALRVKTVTKPLLDTFFQSGCVTALRRDQFLGLGGYGEVFDWYCEDVDLAWRYWNAGFRVVVDGRAQCMHLEGATLGKTDVLGRRQVVDGRFVERMYYYNRNFLLLFARNAPWYQFAMQLPFIFARQCIELIAATLTIRNGPLAKAYLRAWRDAWLRLPRALRNVNASVPATRRSTLRFVRLPVAETLDRMLGFLRAKPPSGDDG